VDTSADVFGVQLARNGVDRAFAVAELHHARDARAAERSIGFADDAAADIELRAGLDLGRQRGARRQFVPADVIHQRMDDAISSASRRRAAGFSEFHRCPEGDGV
jgi:hypothetical protein